MGSLTAHLRRHRLQRRVLTAGVAAVVGLVVATVLHSHVSDWLLIRDLADPSPSRRAQAILRAAHTAQRSQQFARKLEVALATGDDTQFAAVVSALKAAGRFDVPERNPLHIDRMRALAIGQARSADDQQAAAGTREMILAKILLSE